MRTFADSIRTLKDIASEHRSKPWSETLKNDENIASQILSYFTKQFEEFEEQNTSCDPVGYEICYSENLWVFTITIANTSYPFIPNINLSKEDCSEVLNRLIMAFTTCLKDAYSCTPIYNDEKILISIKGYLNARLSDSV